MFAFIYLQWTRSMMAEAETQEAPQRTWWHEQSQVSGGTVTAGPSGGRGTAKQIDCSGALLSLTIKDMASCHSKSQGATRTWWIRRLCHSVRLVCWMCSSKR